MTLRLRVRCRVDAAGDGRGLPWKRHEMVESCTIVVSEGADSHPCIRPDRSGATMELCAEQVRAGHRINGAAVLWARPIPDYSWLCVAVEAAEPGGADVDYQWFRPGDLVTVDGDSEVVSNDTGDRTPK